MITDSQLTAGHLAVCASAEWRFIVSRRAAALRELLATIGMETPQKAVAKIVPALITAILVAWFYPAENPWGKAAAGAVALLIVMAILYGWGRAAISRREACSANSGRP